MREELVNHPISWRRTSCLERCLHSYYQKMATAFGGLATPPGT